MMLELHFDEVAREEYSWLKELKILGYSPENIAEELIRRETFGPWIFRPFLLPFSSALVEDHHQKPCVHTMGQTEALEKADAQEETSQQILHEESVGDNDFVFTPRQSIEYLCGLGGVRPSTEGRALTEMIKVTFRGSTAVIDCDVTGSHADEMLGNLADAVGMLQKLGGCCDSFTFLYRHLDVLELRRVPVSAVGRLRQGLKDSAGLIDVFLEVMPFFKLLQVPDPEIVHRDRLFLADLSARFLALCFLSYAQGHCGPMHPFYLDSPLDSVLLQQGPFALHGLLVESTCLGDMAGGPLFAFYTDWGLRRPRRHPRPKPDRKMDVLACVEDVLDTWGPGEVLTANDKPDELLAASVGGGTIIAVGTTSSRSGRAPQLLHWSAESPISANVPLKPFGCRETVRIGATVTENFHCSGDPNERLRRSAPCLSDLGVLPGRWERSERQVGLSLQAQAAQAGLSGLASAQFNQSWVKRKNVTKKAVMLARPQLYVPDLESLLGVQVSVCTGIARRVRLRDLLADVLPAYVAGLVTRPEAWGALSGTHEIARSLWGDEDLKCWLGRLDHAQQAAFESLAREVLHLLRDTGIDRRGEDFTVACIQPDLPIQCFKIPCKEESTWARMLADSEDTATFAYVTTRCLETSTVKCSGPAAPWGNSTAMLWTAVSCREEQAAAMAPRLSAATRAPPPTPAAGPGSTVGPSPGTTAGPGTSTRGAASTVASAAPARWALRHADSYLIGHSDTALFVTVDRPDGQAEPKLLVSPSRIPREWLHRLRYGGFGTRPRTLKEKRRLDDLAEAVVVLVGRRDGRRAEGGGSQAAGPDPGLRAALPHR